MENYSGLCLKCGGEMAVGYVLDQSYPLNFPAQWVEGPPRRTFWGGLKGGRGRSIVAHRCNKCGYLELFAP